MTLTGAPLPELEQAVITEKRSSRAQLLLPPTLHDTADEVAAGLHASLNEFMIAAVVHTLKTLPKEVLEYLRQAPAYERDRREVAAAAAAAKPPRRSRRKGAEPQLALMPPLSSAEG